MLSFDQHPPITPEDIHLSEIGRGLLERGEQEGNPEVTKAYGKAAASEIVDSLEEHPGTPLGVLSHQVTYQAFQTLRRAKHSAAFLLGMVEVFDEHVYSAAEELELVT